MPQEGAMGTKTDTALESRIGNRIRDIRKQKKITLIELANLTGVAQATLSRMETGQMLGTVESHQKIAEALGVSLSNLYEGIDKRTEGAHRFDAAEKRKVVAKNDSSRVELLISNVTSKKLIPTLTTLNAKGKTAMDKSERGVEEFLWVLEGKVKVVFENSTYELDVHDSLYFDSSAPHQLVNIGSGQAKVVSISSK